MLPVSGIDALIASLLPGAASAPAAIRPGLGGEPFPPAVRYTPSASGKEGVIGGAAPLVYTRKDAMGGQGKLAAADPSRPAEAQGQGENSPSAGPEERPQGADGAARAKKANGQMLSAQEVALLRELQKADQAVRAHEMAHLAAAAGYAKGGASFSYQRGPDGQSYAVAGEVQIDTSRERTPEATMLKMQIVRQAALAPADPSPQDQRVAAQATLQIAESAREMFELQAKKTEQAMQSAAPAPREGQDSTSSPQGIYQEVGRGLAQSGAAAGPSPKSRPQPYMAVPSPAAPGPRAVDRMA